MNIPTDDSIYSIINNIEKSGQQAADLCRQMMAYTGNMPTSYESMNLNFLIKDMAPLIDSSASGRCKIKYLLDQNLPPIKADQTQIRQVLLNLAINACESCEKQCAIQIATGVRHYDRTLLQTSYLDKELPEGKYVYLEFDDSGTGIEALILPRIFDPFFSTKFAGRGLGLAVVHGIISAHKGAILVKSQVGQGSTFTILFPIAEGEIRRSQPEGPSIPATPWHSQGKILIADDEPVVLEITGKVLETAGFQITTATNGQEAVDSFKNQHNDYRAVVLDLTMPILNGRDAYMQIRAIDPSLNILLISGYDEQQARLGFADDPHLHFLQKPYQSLDLLAKLKTILAE